MKELVANYWKKIMIAIGGVFIFINSFRKILAPKVLISDYVKYGKNIEKVPSHIAGQVGGKINPGTMPFDAGMVKLIVGLMIAILFILLITSFAESKSGAKKK